MASLAPSYDFWDNVRSQRGIDVRGLGFIFMEIYVLLWFLDQINTLSRSYHLSFTKISTTLLGSYYLLNAISNF